MFFRTKDTGLHSSPVSVAAEVFMQWKLGVLVFDIQTSASRSKVQKVKAWLYICYYLAIHLDFVLAQYATS